MRENNQNRANFLGTEFNIWSPGENPSKAKSPAEVREQLGAVLYVSFIFLLSEYFNNTLLYDP